MGMEHLSHLSHIWKKIADMASDLGVPYTTAHSWAARRRVPADRDLDLIAAAKKRGKKLTLEDLANARREKRSEAA